MEQLAPHQPQWRAILVRVAQCLESLVGGSGHLASYNLDPETFRIDRVEPLDGGQRRFHFSAVASYESELTVYDDQTPEQRHPISGTIVLDRNLDFVFDSGGAPLLAPYKTALRAGQTQNEAAPRVLSTEEIDRLLKGG